MNLWFESLQFMISHITNKRFPVVKEWWQRPLESIYTVVFLDNIYFYVVNFMVNNVRNSFRSTISTVCNNDIFFINISIIQFK